MKYMMAVVMVLVAGVAYGQTWHTANQRTVAWDAADGATSYRIYLKPSNNPTPIQIGEVTATEAVFTLPRVGRYYPCVQSVAGEDVSELSCSDVAENCLNGVTFGLRMNPGKPGNLR